MDSDKKQYNRGRMIGEESVC